MAEKRDLKYYEIFESILKEYSKKQLDVIKDAYDNNLLCDELLNPKLSIEKMYEIISYVEEENDMEHRIAIQELIEEDLISKLEQLGIDIDTVEWSINRLWAINFDSITIEGKYFNDLESYEVDNQLIEDKSKEIQLRKTLVDNAIETIKKIQLELLSDKEINTDKIGR